MDKISAIKKAIEVLNKGGIIIYPTDTAFGIGCRIDNALAVKKLFNIRKRPATQPVPVLVDSVAMAEDYLVSPLPNNVRRMMNDYWPGSVTVISIARENKVDPLVRGGAISLGVRMPDHEAVLKIISTCKVPLLGPSANFHNDPTPYTLSGLNPELVKLVDFVVPGVCRLNQASTVIDTSVTPWKVLRQGKVVIDIGNNYEL